MPDMTSPHPLILASRVNGTAVYNTNNERIGHIEDVAIGKLSGQVAYAILSIGGFLGMGEKYHPVPWSVLTYDTGLDGYVLPLDKQQLKAAPSYSKDELADVGDIDERLRAPVYGYYADFGARPYWP
jgi:sporulation protein YlmC with PRC-barrel domain